MDVSTGMGSIKHLEDKVSGSSYIFQNAQGMVLHLEPRQEVVIPVQLELPELFEFAFFCSGNTDCLVTVQMVRPRKWWRGNKGEKLAELKTKAPLSPFMADFRVFAPPHKTGSKLVLMMDGSEVDSTSFGRRPADAQLLLRFSSEMAGEVSLSFFKLWDVPTGDSP